MICPQRILNAAVEALRREARRLELEQAPRGIDALAELALHPVLREGLLAAGLGVLAEQPYPGWAENPEKEGGNRPSRALRRDRLRCDLVVLPEAGATLLDPVAERLEAEERAETLFKDVGENEGNGLEARHGVSRYRPEDAFWLEVKAVGQWCFTRGVPGPNRTYSSEMFAAAADLPKLAADPHIWGGGLLLVIFAADQRTTEHDAGLVLERARRELPGLVLHAEGFAIADTIGNSWCCAALLTAAS